LEKLSDIRMNLLKKDTILAIVLGLTISLYIYSIRESELAGAISLSLFTFILSLWMMHKTIRIFDFRRVTICSLWYFTYLAMIYFSSFLVFFRRPEPYRSTYLFSVGSVLITVPVGIFITNTLLRFSTTEIDQYYESPIFEVKKVDINKFLVIFILFLVVLVITLTYFSRIKTIPLLYMLKHPHEVYKLMIMREQVFKLLDPRWSASGSTKMFYIYLFLRTTIYPFLIMLTLGYYLISRQLKWLFLFIGTLFIGGFYAASSIARSPVAAIFMRVFFFYFIYKKGYLNKKSLIVLLILILAFPTFITAFAYGSNMTIIDAIQRVGKRLFYTPAWSLYYYFEIFPQHHNFLYGQTIAKPFLQFFTKDFFYVENYVYKYIFPQGVETGHENDAFISNCYADFGLLGVILGGILVGIIMQTLQIYLLRQKKTISNIAIYSFMIYAFWVLNSGSITSVLFVNGVIPVLIFVWFIKFLERVLSPKGHKPVSL